MSLKKVVVGVLVFSMVIPFCGCGKKSDVSIDDLEEEIQDLYDEVEFSKREKNNGYSFSCDHSGYGITGFFSISGTADSDEMLLTVEIEYENVDVDYLNDLTLSDISYNSSHMGDLYPREFNACGFIVISSITADLLTDDDESLGIIMDCIDDSHTYNENGWEFSITTDRSDETATFVATFVGE